MDSLVHVLPHVNATLNGLAAVLLITGFVLIKQRREAAHRRVMLASFAVSVVFLACYVVYHAMAGSRQFPTTAPSAIRIVYYANLLLHVILAATVPFLATATIYLGLRDRRAAHRRMARVTFPIWLYVSISGVIVYWMLYHLAPGL